MQLYEAAGKEKVITNNSYTTNIEKGAKKNSYFRQVLNTTKRTQLVLMSLKPNEDIGMESHNDGDQFIRVESGNGKVILNGKEESFDTGNAVVVGAGTEHNIINLSDSETMQLYVVYSPPQHKEGTIDKNKPEND